MRFSDIKKFWESQLLGGHASKQTQTCNKLTTVTRALKSNVSGKKSIFYPYVNPDQCNDDGDGGTSTYYAETKTTLPSNADAESDVQEEIASSHVTQANRKNTNDISSTLIFSKLEQDKKKSHGKFGVKQARAMLRVKTFFNQKREVEDLREEKQTIDMLSEKCILSCKPVSAMPKNTQLPRKSHPPKKASMHGMSKTVDGSGISLNEDCTTKCSLENQTSLTDSSLKSVATPSGSISPSGRIKGDNGASHPSQLSKEKFNKVKGFWKMREKKLKRRSLQERSCVVCGCYLSNSFFKQEGALYCEEHFWDKYGESCKKCSGCITGPILIAGFYHFHPECFECSCCKRCISEGDLYVLIICEEGPHRHDSTLFCIICYKGLLTFSEKDQHKELANVKCTMIIIIDFYSKQPFSGQQDFRPTFATHLGVTVKNHPVSCDGLKLSTGQLVSGIDSTSNPSLLVGDVILQINGLAVNSNALELMDRLLDDSHTPLKLTIQREVFLSSTMCFDVRLCDHITPPFTPTKISLEPIEFPLVDGQAICEQPQISIHQIHGNQQSCDLKNTKSQDHGIDNIFENQQTLCTPFTFSVSDSFCCESPQTPNISRHVVEKDRVVEFPPTAGHALVVTQNSERNLSISSYTTTDSGVGEDNCLSDSNTFSLNLGEDDVTKSSLDNATQPTGLTCKKSLGALQQQQQDAVLQQKEDVADLSSSRKDRPGDSVELSTMFKFINNDLAQSELNIQQTRPSNFADSIFVDESADASEKTNQRTTSPASFMKTNVAVARTNSLLNLKVKLPSIPESEADCAKNSSPTSLGSNLHEIKQNASGLEEDTAQKNPRNTARHVQNDKTTNSLDRSNSLRKINLPYATIRKSPRCRSYLKKSTFSVYDYSSMHYVDTDLNRSESMRIHGRMERCYRVFRPCDLIHGEVLGQGFFGKAIKVTHRDTGEVMVLKVLNSLEPNYEKSFLKEVKVMRNLFHRNVIHFIGVLYKDKRLNIITEYVECGTLKDVLTNMEEELPWQRRIDIARDITSGMFYLHSMNIIHRDLNSGNCFVKKDGTVVVADFGLARIHSKSACLGRSKRYTVVGNPYWMAPEMLYGSIYDERVDIFSFGIVLCEIIGRVEADPDYLPRSNDFGLAVLDFHSKFCESCPAFLFAIAVQASSLRPEDRPSFQELAGWFEMLAIREELERLPDPPNLQTVISSVYAKYNLPLPIDLYSPPAQSDNISFSVSSNRSSSATSITSVSYENDFLHVSNSCNDTFEGTGFFASSTICSRL